MEGPFTTPILLLIFNRPQETFLTFEQIKKIKPAKLFIAADGPRKKSPEDGKLCMETRAITQKIDWPCEVHTLFREENLGCKYAVSGAISWFFTQVEAGIILEDDCLPNQSFFLFCAEMLKRYADNKNIMLISGTNLLGEWSSGKNSYHFSIYGGIWGWASWRRAWNLYDVEMKEWENPKIKRDIKKFIGNSKQYEDRACRFNRAYSGKANTWDYQWSFTRLKYRGLSVVPKVNLIENIGFGRGATHTLSLMQHRIPSQEIITPFLFEGQILPDKKYDQFLFKKMSPDNNLVYKIITRIKKWIL